MTNASSGAAQFAITQDGALAYVPGGVRLAERVLVWVDRSGADQQILADRRAFWWPRVSPSGDRVAITITDGAKTDVWVSPVGIGSLSRLTLEGNNGVPVWSPDGKRIAFMSDRDGQWNIYWKQADGGGADERLARSTGAQVPGSFSADGKLLAYTELSARSRNDIWVLPLEGDRTPRPLAQGPASEWGGSFCPKASWLAFTSDESGRQEIYLQEYPGPGTRFRVSTEGGSDPRWGPRGDEIFYRSGDSVLAATVALSPQPVISGRRTLFSGRFEEATGSFPNYDVAPDGSRFVMIRTADAGQAPLEMHFVLGWFDELRRRTSTPR
jgi:Tol biopolymer transport system component